MQSDQTPEQGPRDLAILENACRSLAQAKTLEDVKAVRDKAEAARHYAKSAALGLQIQNLAAELKLRAERKAGDLLAKLCMRGGDRKSKSRHEILKLADLGIDRNKSARWQLEASIPESVFLDYLAVAEESGAEITSQGLFRLANKSAGQRRRGGGQDSARGRASHDTPGRGITLTNGLQQKCSPKGDRAVNDIATELADQRQLLATVLTPFCENRQNALPIECKRTILRLLDEMDELLTQLKTTRAP